MTWLWLLLGWFGLLGVLELALVEWPLRRDRHRPDYARIAWLERELGIGIEVVAPPSLEAVEWGERVRAPAPRGDRCRGPLARKAR